MMQSIYYTIMSFALKFSKEERRGSDERWSGVKRQFLETEEMLWLWDYFSRMEETDDARKRGLNFRRIL